MKVRNALVATLAWGLLIASPAAADWDGRGKTGADAPPDHTHKCGCGHKGWDCKPGSDNGSPSSENGQSGGDHSSGGSSGGDSGGTPVPEPADFALFAAGVLGLIIGRRGARTRRPSR